MPLTVTLAMCAIKFVVFCLDCRKLKLQTWWYHSDPKVNVWYVLNSPDGVILVFTNDLLVKQVSSAYNILKQETQAEFPVSGEINVPTADELLPKPLAVHLMSQISDCPSSNPWRNCARGWKHLWLQNSPALTRLASTWPRTVQLQ